MKYRIVTVAAAIMLFSVGSYAQNNEYKSTPTQVSWEGTLLHTAPKAPSSVKFAGEEIDLTRADRHERMDREMLAFSYSHQLTLLMLKRTTKIFPQIEPILKEYGIPDDMKYLMVIESNLSPTAVSAAGAAGLWQFMAATARQYGLEVSETVDERYHIEKATRAACKYLKEAYKKYGDWMSVCASYNGGQARISTQLEKQRAESAMDLWLVEETSRYMFRVLAAKLFMENPEKYGFKLDEDDYYPYVAPEKTVIVTDTVDDLAAFAEKHGISYLELRTANPWIKGNILQDKSHKEYKILIPKK